MDLLGLRGQLHFLGCTEPLPSLTALPQIFRWHDEEMSGYPFLCQSQKPLPNTALADTGRLGARQTLGCVLGSSKYLHLIPKGSIDERQLSQWHAEPPNAAPQKCCCTLSCLLLFLLLLRSGKLPINHSLSCSWKFC